MTTWQGPAVETVPGLGALTLGSFLEDAGARFGSNEALVFDDPLQDGRTVRWTYTDLLDEARRIAVGLLAHDLEPGEAVGILMGNRPEAVASIFGAALAGAVTVPMSTFAPPPELADMLQRADVAILLTQDRLLDRRLGGEVHSLAPELKTLRHAAVVGTSSWARLRGDQDLPPAALTRRSTTVTPDDDALVIFSSGTTSRPKGVVHAHGAASLQFRVLAHLFGRHEATRMWTSLPLFWTAGLHTAMGSTLAAGGCWVMQETFEPGAALALMARERVTEPYSLPHQTAALEEHPAWPTTDLSSLRCVFGKSAFARHPAVQGDTTWNMPVGYGLSETCAFFVGHPSDTPRERLKQSTGRLLPGNELRIVDPASGAALGPDEPGELAVKGPTLMRRYLGQSPAACVDADGFFHTGDAGFVDADGDVHFTGRRTEMIKTGGANVSPAELEVQLRACPGVKLSRVLGVEDGRLGQIVVACITLQDGAEVTEADVQAFLRERVAPYKVPRRVLFLEPGELPMTGSDTKVRDAELAGVVARRLTADPLLRTSGDR